jgi:toxin ParE1/3/4
MQCIFTEQAERDLEAIADYIALDNPIRALSFVQEIRDRCYKFTYAPKGVAVFPEYGENVRKVPFGNYRILYTLQGDDVVILHISHGAMNEP